MINYVMAELNNKFDERINYVTNVFTVSSSLKEEENHIYVVNRLSPAVRIEVLVIDFDDSSAHNEQSKSCLSSNVLLNL